MLEIINISTNRNWTRSGRFGIYINERHDIDKRRHLAYTFAKAADHLELSEGSQL
jgi:hypothetical protein